MSHRKFILFALAIGASALSTQGFPASGEGNVASGQKAYQACAMCHGERGQGTDIGPDLRKIVGREVAADAAYIYSGAMRRYGGTWTEERLVAFLMQPQATVRGNRMPYAGAASKAQAQDLVDYLKSLK